MSSLAQIISGFTNREFAYFLKYLLLEFSTSSKEIIYEELKSRNLNKEELIRFTEELFIPVTGNCNRCNSDNFYTESRTEQTGSRYNPEIEIHTNRCIVCGYNSELEEQLNPKGFWGWIKNVLKFSD